MEGLLFGTAGVWGGMAALAWRQRGSLRPARWLASLFLALGEWTFAAAMERMAPDAATGFLWRRLELAGAMFVPPLALLNALRWTAFPIRLRPLSYRLLFALPALTLPLILAADPPALIWRAPARSHRPFFPETLTAYGPLFWLLLAFAVLAMGWGALILLSSALHAARPHRWPPAAMGLSFLFATALGLDRALGWTGPDGSWALALGMALLALEAVFLGFRHGDPLLLAHRAVLERLPAPLLAFNRQGRAVMLNQAMADWLGIAAPEEAYRQSLEALLAPWPSLRSAVEALRRGLPIPPMTIEREGGRVFRLQGEPLRWLGEPVGGLLLLWDLTPMRQLEREREQLQQMIVHDLRHPAATIQTVLSALAGREEPSNLERHELLAIAQRATGQLLARIHTLLMWSQLEHGGFPLEPQPVALPELIEEVLTLFRPIAMEREISLRCTLAEDLPTVWGDRALLQRVLENLLDNALKFTPSGGWVAIEAARAGEAARLSVIDSGPAIPEALLPHLFRPFVTGLTPGRGIGLGLAFCRKAVEAHGGRIAVENLGENGVAFHIFLPLNVNEVTPPPRGGGNGSPALSPLHPEHRMRHRPHRLSHAHPPEPSA